MTLKKSLTAALMAVGLATVGCDRGREVEVEDDDVTTEEQLEAEETEIISAPAIPHGDDQTVFVKEEDEDETVTDRDLLVPRPPRTLPADMPPPAPSGDPRLHVPMDDRTPPQQDTSNRQYADEPLPP